MEIEIQSIKLTYEYYVVQIEYGGKWIDYNIDGEWNQFESIQEAEDWHHEMSSCDVLKWSWRIVHRSITDRIKSTNTPEAW